MRKISLLSAIFCSFILGGCLTSEKEDYERRFRDFQNYSWYYKDWSADVCYSMYGRPRFNYFSHAAVPCTEKVMALIVNKRESGCHENCDKTKKTFLPERESE